MTVRLYIAPAAGGKTAYVLDLVRQAAAGLAATPRVVVAGHLQVRACRRRLAASGGALGVRILTFDRLYAECLSACGEAYTELSEPVEYRLLRAVVDDLPLRHYAPLVPRPGFVQVLERLIGELKAARVSPAGFAAAVEAMGAEPRLGELAQVYGAYQERLQERGWADRAGLGWLAVKALEVAAPQAVCDWPLLAVDGFDNFTPVQLVVLRGLASRVTEMIITLTGTGDGPPRPLVHRRFERTRRQLEATLGVAAAPLPGLENTSPPARPGDDGAGSVLAHLEAGLFRSGVPRCNAAGVVDLVEAPDRATEVRAALRWLKARIVQDGLQPSEMALLARAVEPYRPFIQQTAAEFGLPVRLIDGLPLRANPAVAALLELLRLMLPVSAADAEPALPRRGVIEAWRSPYFDWSSVGHTRPAVPGRLGSRDADLLDAAARWGRVVGGLSQWQEALEHLVLRARRASRQPAQSAESSQLALQVEEDDALPAELPRAAEAEALAARFDQFVRRLMPPRGAHPAHRWVGWLEDLIGPDPFVPKAAQAADPSLASACLNLVACARAAAGTAERDVAALQALKDLLRGLVWAEEALGNDRQVDYVSFLGDLTGAVDAATYQLPWHPTLEAIVVADVVQARGVPYRAAAVLGLAEGEFPSALGEDPFLRDADRQRLRDQFGLPLEPSTESAEPEYFYEAVTRARERLLLTRPRLADNGAPWQASPFWEEVQGLVEVRPQTIIGETIASPAVAASWPELMESLAVHPGPGPYHRWAQQAAPEQELAVEAAAKLFRLRHGRPCSALAGTFDGGLGDLAAIFARRFGSDHTWSASRLEAYRSCPFSFFVGYVLGLEPREEPAEGLDAAQLGTVYHHILERVYQAPSVTDPADLEQLLAALPGAAAAVLDAAPEEVGFRVTAWWAHTRQEMVANVQRCLAVLTGLADVFVPVEHEVAFGLEGRPALVITGEEGDRLRLHGFIDRVDRAPDGRIRVIDYKSGGPWPFTLKAVAEGKKLQLPLYALAARDALGMGEPVEGFYWHVRQAQASPFSLARFEGGPEAAIEAAVAKAWEAVRGARSGLFVPCPPDNGCPAYCPAAGFCWHYRPGFAG